MDIRTHLDVYLQRFHSDELTEISRHAIAKYAEMYVRFDLDEEREKRYTREHLTAYIAKCLCVGMCCYAAIRIVSLIW